LFTGHITVPNTFRKSPTLIGKHNKNSKKVVVPAKSKAQFRWLHTEDAKKKLGSAGVKEWEGATGSPKSLPEKVTKKRGHGKNRGI
jgi:hypothetical protein